MYVLLTCNHDFEGYCHLKTKEGIRLHTNDQNYGVCFVFIDGNSLQTTAAGCVLIAMISIQT